MCNRQLELRQGEAHRCERRKLRCQRRGLRRQAGDLQQGGGRQELSMEMVEVMYNGGVWFDSDSQDRRQALLPREMP